MPSSLALLFVAALAAQWSTSRRPEFRGPNFFSSAAHVTERIRRPRFGTLDIDVTVNDPKVFTKAWTVNLHMRPLLDTEMIELYCQENNKAVERFVK